jgi:hypothetical protein
MIIGWTADFLLQLCRDGGFGWHLFLGAEVFQWVWEVAVMIWMGVQGWGTIGVGVGAQELVVVEKVERGGTATVER